MTDTSMTDTRPIHLGGRAFDVPALPLRINREVYPICRRFEQSDLIGRCIASGGALDCTDEEFDALARIAFLCANLADPTLTREAFDDLPVPPPQLLDAFFVIRYQTGAWVPATEKSEGNGEGEAAGAKRPRK